MKMTIILSSFVSGMGLKIVVSYVPPSIAAWTFFILPLQTPLMTQSERFAIDLILGLTGSASTAPSSHG